MRSNVFEPFYQELCKAYINPSLAEMGETARVFECPSFGEIYDLVNGSDTKHYNPYHQHTIPKERPSKEVWTEADHYARFLGITYLTNKQKGGLLHGRIRPIPKRDEQSALWYALMLKLFFDYQICAQGIEAGLRNHNKLGAKRLNPREETTTRSMRHFREYEDKGPSFRPRLYTKYVCSPSELFLWNKVTDQTPVSHFDRTPKITTTCKTVSFKDLN